VSNHISIYRVVQQTETQHCATLQSSLLECHILSRIKPQQVSKNEQNLMFPLTQKVILEISFFSVVDSASLKGEKTGVEIKDGAPGES